MLSPFECLCGNFILPEPASYVFSYAIFNLHKLLYIISGTGGYYATTDKGAKYLRPEFVDEYARNIAASLNEMKPAEFAAMLRDLKRAKKSTLPFEARKTAAAELLPRAIGLVHKKKAPSILTEFIKVNLAAIKTDDDWSAFYRHMNAINGYLVLNTADK